MECAKCKAVIEKGAEQYRYSQALCEDCYMDALSPARACDPWAVHSAKSFAKEQGGRLSLSDIQKKILEILKESGGIEPHILSEQVQMRHSDLEREIAALRHMEKLRAALRDDGKKILVLW